MEDPVSRLVRQIPPVRPRAARSKGGMKQKRVKVVAKNNETKEVVKGSWSEEEDAKLKRLVQERGPERWHLIAAHLDGRKGKQCRERWFNHLAPSVKKSWWTKEEDETILRMHAKVGNKWAEIAMELPGRTANAVKNHWNATLLRRLVTGEYAALYPELYGQDCRTVHEAKYKRKLQYNQQYNQRNAKNRKIQRLRARGVAVGNAQDVPPTVQEEEDTLHAEAEAVLPVDDGEDLPHEVDIETGGVSTRGITILEAVTVDSPQNGLRKSGVRRKLFNETEQTDSPRQKTSARSARDFGVNGPMYAYTVKNYKAPEKTTETVNEVLSSVLGTSTLLNMRTTAHDDSLYTASPVRTRPSNDDSVFIFSPRSESSSHFAFLSHSSASTDSRGTMPEHLGFETSLLFPEGESGTTTKSTSIGDSAALTHGKTGISPISPFMFHRYHNETSFSDLFASSASRRRRSTPAQSRSDSFSPSTNTNGYISPGPFGPMGCLLTKPMTDSHVSHTLTVSDTSANTASAQSPGIAKTISPGFPSPFRSSNSPFTLFASPGFL